LVFVWFWTSQFIVAVGQLVVALAVSIWYFTRDRKQVGNSTFIKSVCLVSVYHLGTAAFGSLIIAIIKTIRAILTYIQKKATKSRLRLAMVVLTVLKCLLWCLEKCLKFVNKQAYIQTGEILINMNANICVAFFMRLKTALS
jgi:choline transporter-like protein 2/4/5